MNFIYKDSKKYSENNKLQYNFAHQTIAKIKVDKNSRVLDIGCGDGLITSEIAKKITEGCVVGTDISSEMIEHATQTYWRQKNLLFLQMNACKNIFKNQFDIITSFNSLHWIKNQKKAIEGISNAATREGQVAILLSHKKSEYHLILEKLQQCTKWKKYFENFVNPRNFFSANFYKKIILKNSFSINSFEERKMDYFFNHPDEFKLFFRSANAHANQINREMCDEFAHDFLTEMTGSYSKGEKIPVSFWCLEIIAKKVP